jgi:hypothetical protein
MKNKVVHTDPTYLRTIHDGLLSGAVHKDNASALPMGLVGMYEEALPSAANVNERKKFLEFFVVWAVLKKEVSAEFVLLLLEGWTEEEVIDYIAKYSKWFNSPVSGKYVLYHERLRTFVLQKVSHHHFEKCNEQIIHQCRLALQVKASDEWERYTMEFLSEHLLTEGMISGNCNNLMNFSRSKEIWRRQIELSVGMEWSKKAIYNLIDLNSKYDPFACQIDYLNLLKLFRDSRDYINYFNKIEIQDLSELEILRLQNVSIQDEYDGQFLYVSVIIKIHRCLNSGLENGQISVLIDGLDKVLSKVQAIEHGKLNFHDVIPLPYFEDVFEYYKNEGRNYKNLLSSQYEFSEFEIGNLNSSSNLHEFILKNQSLDRWPLNIPENIDELFDGINNCFVGIDLSEIENLGKLYGVLENEELDDIPISILIVPILFRRKFSENPFYQNIKAAWIEEFMDSGGLNTPFTFAFSLLRSLSDERCDKVELNRLISYFASHGLSSHKYDSDGYLLFFSEYKYWSEGSSFFEQWLLDVLNDRVSVEIISIIEDQKYQVFADFYWDSKLEYEMMLRQHISPFLVSYYISEFNESQQNNEIEKAITYDEISNLDNKYFLTHDFACGQYYRSMKSVNSPVSVKKITWLNVLPRLRNIDNNTLFTTMHKVFLKSLCYTNEDDLELPADAKTFYDFKWLDSVLDE